MILLVDVGNTRTKWCWRELDGQWGDRPCEAPAAQLTTADIDWQSVVDQQERPLDGIAVSQVGGAGHTESLRAIAAEAGTLFFVAETEAVAPGIINSYEHPRAMGVDRWLAMLGAQVMLAADGEREDSGFCVIDCGSAVTLDVVSVDGTHQGGHIVNGLNMMQRSLLEKTGKISDGWSLSEQSEVEHWLGNSTREAVELGARAMLEGYLLMVIKALQNQHGISQLFLTGGDAPSIAKWPGMESCQLEPELVFVGLWQQFCRLQSA